MVLSACSLFFFILLRFSRLSNNHGEAFRYPLVQHTGVGIYLVVSHFGIDLGRLNPGVSQHLADRFKRNPMSERDFGRIGMAAGMKTSGQSMSQSFAIRFKLRFIVLLEYMGSSFPSGAVSLYFSMICNGRSSRGFQTRLRFSGASF